MFAEELVKLLKRKNLTLCAAESCTGGEIASHITKIAGCSAVFKGSAVTYCNAAKHNILGVKTSTLDNYTEYSHQTVSEMADGALKLFDSDFAISTSGIAGPDGGTEENPVGTVYFGLAQKNCKTITQKICFNSNNRAQNIEKATETALKMVLERINK